MSIRTGWYVIMAGWVMAVVGAGFAGADPHLMAGWISADAAALVLFATPFVASKIRPGRDD